MVNNKVRVAAVLASVTMRELAEELGVAKTSLSRALREELPEHRATEMLEAIHRIESAPGRQEKLRRRDEYLRRTGMSIITFYRKLRTDTFRPLEAELFNQMFGGE